MSINVENLTKIYGEQKALDSISFQVKKGDILGFLGPNGAGKTTTMKILTCFIPQTSGKAEICGLDTRTESIEIRRLIGYLPENNPLYKDMYIKEYLLYIANLYKLDQPHKRVSDMIDLTGLGLEQHKLISQISKGYKQRVGLAQAMIHNPEVLIMDEPTSGLDPNQLAEIRAVIKEIGKEKAVIFSTHIMQEVEALCNKVIIINRGNIVINDDILALPRYVKGSNAISVHYDRDITGYLSKWKSIGGVTSLEQLGKDALLFTSSDKEDIRPVLFDQAVAAGVRIIGMEQKTLSIEDIFQQLTKQQNN